MAGYGTVEYGTVLGGAVGYGTVRGFAIGGVGFGG